MHTNYMSFTIVLFYGYVFLTLGDGYSNIIASIIMSLLLYHAWLCIFEFFADCYSNIMHVNYYTFVIVLLPVIYY